MRRGLIAGGWIALLLVAVPSATAAPPDPACSYPAAYPGDTADKPPLAGWMANGAVARGIPPELPVMAALVESNIQNLPEGGTGYAGYFQMRVSFWEADYPGFPANPDLQLKWFVDQALSFEDQHAAGGESEYGEWVADIERPAAQFRGRYQPRLEDARGLIAQTCTIVPGGGGPGGGTTAPDLSGPALKVALARRPRVRGIVAKMSCPHEACVASLKALVRVPNSARVYRVASKPVELTAGVTKRVRIKFGRRLRRHARLALEAGKRVRANVTVDVADPAGNHTVLTRKQRLRI